MGRHRSSRDGVTSGSVRCWLWRASRNPMATNLFAGQDGMSAQTALLGTRLEWAEG